MTVFQGISAPNVIYKTHSDYNGDIEVIDTGKILKLHVNGTVQSVSRDSKSAESRVWGRVVSLLQETEPNLQNVLVLGLGGATMQHLISKRFPHAEIVTVDIDPVMVDVAKKYFHIDEIPNHTIIVGDACGIIIHPEQYGMQHKQFDAIIVDIFCGEQYPALGNSGNFLSHIALMTKTNGLAIFNRMYKEHHQDDVHMFMDNVEMYFNDVNSIVIPGKTNSDNILIYGRA